MYVEMFFFTLLCVIDLMETSPDHKAACVEVISNLNNSDGGLTEEDLVMITELPDSHSPSAQFHSVLLKEMMKLKDDPVLALLEMPDSENKKSFNYLFRNAEYKNSAKVCVLNCAWCLCMYFIIL